MPVVTLYKIQCDGCREFLPQSSAPPGRLTVTYSAASPASASQQDAEAAAHRRGWSVYPLLCPRCKETPR